MREPRLRPFQRITSAMTAALICTLLAVVVAPPAAASAAPTGPERIAADAARTVIPSGTTASDASITGTVADKAGIVLPGVAVRLLRVDPNGYVLIATRTTDADGRYLFPELGPGEYTLEFRPPRESPQFTQWWGGAPGSTYTTPFALAEHETRGSMDVKLVTAASVFGTVVDPSGAPVTGMPVGYSRLVAGEWTNVIGTWTIDDGRYGFGSLLPGTYKIRFSPAQETGLYAEWWRGRPDRDTATTFTVGDGEVRTGIDVRLSARKVNLATPVIPGLPSVGDTIAATTSSSTPGVAYEYQWFSSYDPIPGATDRTLTVDGSLLGARLNVRVVATAPGYASSLGESEWTGDVQPQPALPGWDPLISRISGNDRYATSVAISRSGFAPGTETVYIASGTDFPDALSGAPLAAMRGGPLLLTPRSGLPAVVIQEIKRLKPKTAIIFGGTGVVSATVESQLRQLTSYATVDRFAGADRYATSAVISQREFSPGNPPEVAYIANGAMFPDALSGAPVAGGDDGPLLLSSSTILPAAVATELKRIKPARIVILGGTGSISVAVARQLEGYTAGSVARVAGVDRYSTSVAVSKASFAPDVPVAYVANGADYPDALAGSTLAGIQHGPVLLTPTGRLPQIVLDELRRLRPAKIVLLGGTGAVSSTVRAQLDALG